MTQTAFAVSPRRDGPHRNPTVLPNSDRTVLIEHGEACPRAVIRQPDMVPRTDPHPDHTGVIILDGVLAIGQAESDILTGTPGIRQSGGTVVQSGEAYPGAVIRQPDMVPRTDHHPNHTGVIILDRVLAIGQAESDILTGTPGIQQSGGTVVQSGEAYGAVMRQPDMVSRTDHHPDDTGVIILDGVLAIWQVESDILTGTPGIRQSGGTVVQSGEAYPGAVIRQPDIVPRTDHHPDHTGVIILDGVLAIWQAESDILTGTPGIRQSGGTVVQSGEAYPLVRFGNLAAWS